MLALDLWYRWQYLSIGGGFGIQGLVVRLMLTTRAYATRQTKYSVEHGGGHSKVSQFDG